MEIKCGARSLSFQEVKSRRKTTVRPKAAVSERQLLLPLQFGEPAGAATKAHGLLPVVAEMHPQAESSGTSSAPGWMKALSLRLQEIKKQSQI